MDFLTRLLIHIDRKLDRIMGDTTALTAAVASLQSEDSALLTAINQTLTDFAAEIAALVAAAGSGDQAQIDAAAGVVNQTLTDLTNATAQVTAADPGAQPAPAAPVAPAAPATPATPAAPTDPAAGNIDATPPGTPTA